MILLSKMEELYQCIVFGYNEPSVCWMHPQTITDYLAELEHHGQPEFMIFNGAKVKPKMGLAPGEVEFAYEVGPYKGCSSSGFVNAES